MTTISIWYLLHLINKTNDFSQAAAMPLAEKIPISFYEDFLSEKLWVKMVYDLNIQKNTADLLSGAYKAVYIRSCCLSAEAEYKSYLFGKRFIQTCEVHVPFAYLIAPYNGDTDSD